MSMDFVQPPHKFQFFSPPIHLKTFLEEAWQAEQALKDVFHGSHSEANDFDTRSNFVALADRLRIDEKEAERVISDVDCGLEAIIEEFPIIDYEPTFPPKDSNLHTHMVLNDMRNVVNGNVRLKNSYLQRGRYWKHRDYELQRTLEPKRCETDKDIILTANIIAPDNVFSNSTRAHKDMRRLCESKFIIRGSMPLSKLREKIFCQSDFWCNKQDFEEARDPTNYFLNRFPSAFLFIYDTFYVDNSNPKSKDISEPIREFMSRKTDSFKDHKVKSIEGVTVDELTIRLGQPYVFIHQGHCEHLIVFTDLRLMNVNDVYDMSDYPILVYDNVTQVLCCTCKENLASFVVTESDRMALNPAFMCEDCFKSFHYERQVRLGSFQAYHYIDRGCLE